MTKNVKGLSSKNNYMNITNRQLYLVRIKSFIWEIGTAAGLALVGFLFSPEFLDPLLGIIKENAGNSTMGIIVFFTIENGIKHARNKWEIYKRENNIAGMNEDDELIII